MEKSLDNIEGDGFLFHLLHFLWLKDPILGVVPSLNVPDTIIFQNDLPYMWYFVKDRCLKRKSNIKLTLEEIEKKFTRKVPKSGIVGVYINQFSNKEGEKMIFEYLTVAQFRSFLYEKQMTQKQGILQRFIQPKAEHNFVVRVIWSPNLCLFEKVENLNNINDKKQDTYQRVLTFEGEHLPSRTVPLRGYILPHRLENIMFNVVKHVSNVTYDNIKIRRIVGNFKIDENDKVWFLNCSSLRVDSTNDSMLRKYIYSDKISESVYETNLKLDIPAMIEKFKLPHFKEANLEKNFKCLQCAKKVNFSSIYKLKYRDVIRGWNLDHFTTVSSDLINEKSNFLSRELKTTRPELDAEQIYYTKSNKLKKNISQIYKNLFNENLRQENFNGYSVASPGNYEENEGLNRGDFNLIELNRNYNIPVIIARLHPSLKEKEYFALSKNPGFLNKNALVCENCYLEIIAHSHANQNYRQIIRKHQKDKEIFGTGKLDPQSIAYRFKETREKILSNGDNRYNTSRRSEPLVAQNEEKIRFFVPKIDIKQEPHSGKSFNHNNSTNSQSVEKTTQRMIDNFFKIGRKTPVYEKLKLKSRGGEQEKPEFSDSEAEKPANLYLKANNSRFPKEKFLNLMLNSHKPHQNL